MRIDRFAPGNGIAVHPIESSCDLENILLASTIAEIQPRLLGKSNGQ
jgi:hypothetical protein